MNTWQFSLDPINWQIFIKQFYDNLQIPYSDLIAEAPGFIIVSAFFLEFCPNPIYSAQYTYLKLLTYYNLFLLLLIIFVICRRISKNPLYFLTCMLLTINMYFNYRFAMLLPSPVTVIFLGLVILVIITPNVPQYMIYLFLSATLLIHPINAVLICGFFFTYKIAMFLIVKIKVYWTSKRQNQKKVTADGEKTTIKAMLLNIIAFLLPLAIFDLGESIRVSTEWYNSLLWYLSPGNLTATILNPNPLSPMLLPILSSPLPPILRTISYIAVWGDPFFWLAIACAFVPTRLYVFTKEQAKMSDFLRISTIVGYLLFILPDLTPLLTLMQSIPGGSIIVGFVNSDFYFWTKYRLFEIIPVCSALLITLVASGIFWHFNKASKNRKFWQILKPLEWRWQVVLVSTLIFQEVLFSTVLTFYCFRAKAFFYQYYEYPFDNKYARDLLIFRDYVDQNDTNDTAPKLVAYNVEEPLMAFCIEKFLPSNYNSVSLWNRTTVEYVKNNVIDNASIPYNYVVIARIANSSIMDDYNWSIMASNSHVIYNNTDIVIFRCK